jgi:putative exosortase-associated protein (TIGR04073 family)
MGSKQSRLIPFVSCFMVLTVTHVFPVSASDIQATTIPPSQSLSHVEQVNPYQDAILERLGRGGSNLAYSPLEIVNHLRYEIRRTDPIRGLVVGTVKGLGWGVSRAAVGAFEVLTFYVPLRPHIHEFDTEWVYV